MVPQHANTLMVFQRNGDKLRFAQCLPEDWKSFKVHYRYRETIYHITVLQPNEGSLASVIVDGVEQPDNTIPLLDDHQEHSVEVRMPVLDKAKKR